MKAAPGVTPVTVLTGYLGSGKTTLLNHLLADPTIEPCAVVINEWGEVPVDHALVRSAKGDVTVLPGGCLCCQVAGDLVRTLRDLHARRAAGEVPPFTRVIIETTGLADPAPLLGTLVELPLVAARFGLAGVVTTVSAEHGMGELDARAESVKQAAMADLVLVTKCDRVAPASIDTLEARLAALNPGARRFRVTLGGGISPDDFFATGLGGRPPAAATGWLNAGAYAPAGTRADSPHDPLVRAFSWASDDAVDTSALEDGLDTLLDVVGDRLLRLKGLVNVRGLAGPVAVHAVQHTVYPLARLAAWPDDDRRTRLVFITRGVSDDAVTGILEPFLRAAGQSDAPSPYLPQSLEPAPRA